MTTVEVSEYDDLRGDQILASRQKDAVVDALAGDTEAVVWLEEWLCHEKTLFSIDGPIEQLFPGDVIAETEKALLFNTTEEDDPDDAIDGVEWVPKSCSRVYVAGDDIDDETPAKSLEDFGSSVERSD